MIRAMGQSEKTKMKIYAGVILFCIVLGLAVYYGVTVSSAATITVGTVNTSSSPLTVRKGPGTQYASLGTVAKGSQVTILEVGTEWHKIVYGNGEGYVSGKYISDIHSYEPTPPDADYIKYLTEQGFPKSYAVELEKLHVKYPNWVFEPVLTGLEWKTVIEKESKIGVNLVQSVNNDAQKSTEAGAYDWATNKWYGYDGAGWVCAAPDMIRYCMDPRNFLNESDIFQFTTNDYKEYQNVDGVMALLNGCFMANNNGAFTDADGVKRTYQDTFVGVGKEIGVSPYHLASRCRQEQGVKGSVMSSGTVAGFEGYYNYFNAGAYPANGYDSIHNGLQCAKDKGWDTRYKAIYGGSKIVGDQFVKRGQNTVYFQKFNVVNKASGLYAHQYMTNVQAAISEGKSIKKGYTDKSAPIEFRIPVYNNMSDKPTPLPTGGNPNNWLKTLEVRGQSLTPGFNPSKTEYSLIVASNVEALEISGTPVVSAAKISGNGSVKLKYGDNTVTIKCTAQNGTSRDYILNIVRKEPEEPEPPVTIKRGDVNGDGKISNVDLVMVTKHVLGIEILSGDTFVRGDVNQDGKVSNVDIVMITKHILGIEKIEW